MKTFFWPTLDNNNPLNLYNIIFFKEFPPQNYLIDSHFTDENSDTEVSEKLSELPEVT